MVKSHKKKKKEKKEKGKKEEHAIAFDAGGQNGKTQMESENGISQNIRHTHRIRGQRVDFYGTPLNRARLNGQSNDKCISYATMSPARFTKIENKSSGIYIAGYTGHTGAI